MLNKFRFPDFSNADMELRFENGVVCIYGTPDGLRKLADVCKDLADHSAQGHIHFDRNEMAPVALTNESEEGAVAVFTERK